MIHIAPSLLAADAGNFRAAAQLARQAGGNRLHFDVMDGSFVPVISFGDHVLPHLRDSGLPLDVHLMVVRPEDKVEAFARAGASILTVHLEATAHIHRVLQMIRAQGIKAGVAVNPGTPVEAIDQLWDVLDQVLIMTVNPGWGGQKMLPATLRKVTQVRRMALEAGADIDISVDGGINPDTAPLAIAAGANVLVAGSSFFGAQDPAGALRRMRGA